MSLSNVKVKVIKTSMSMYAMYIYRHLQFECHSLNSVDLVLQVHLFKLKNCQELLLDAVIEKL